MYRTLPQSYFLNYNLGGIREDPRISLWVDVLDHNLLTILKSSHQDPSNEGSNFILSPLEVGQTAIF
jgi:hypothetical protein